MGGQPGPGIDTREAKTRAALILALALLCTLPWSFRTASFLHAKDAGVCVSLLVLAGYSIRHSFVTYKYITIFAPLWIMLAWTLVFHGLGGQARDPYAVMSECARQSAVILCATCLLGLSGGPGANGRLIRGAVAGCALAAALLALLQYADLAGSLFPAFAHYPQRAYSLFGNQDLLGGFAAIGLPVAIGLLRCSESPKWEWCVPVPLVMALGISGSRSAWLAALVGTAIALLPDARAKRRLLPIVLLLAAASGAIVVAAPEATLSRAVAAVGGNDTGIGVRLWIWDGSLRMIRDRGLFGVGLGNYALWSPSYLGEALQAPGGEGHTHNDRHTLHAHNDPIELLAELGVPGLICAVWILASLRRGKDVAEWGALAASMVFSLFNGTMESPAHVLVSLLLVGRLSRHADGPARPPIAAAWFVPAVCAVVGAVMWTHLIPSARLQSAWREEDAGRDPAPAYRRALRHPWPNVQAAEEFAEYLIGAGRFEEAERPLAIALGGSDTGRVHLLAGMMAERRGEMASARRHFQACLYRWPAETEVRSKLKKLAPIGNQGEMPDASANLNGNSP